MQIENNSQKRGFENTSTSRRMMDISKIQSPSDQQIIALGRVKAIYDAREVETLILNGAITKEEIIKNVKSLDQSRLKHVYLLLQNLRRQATILAKSDESFISKGDLFLFIGKICQLHTNLLCLEGVTRKMEGTGYEWDKYLKLLSDFKPNPVNKEDIANLEEIPADEVIEILDD